MPELRAFKKKLENRLGRVTLLLFGSNATGTAGKDSDVDLIVISPQFTGKKLHKRPQGFWKAWDLDVPVDFICLTPNEFEEKKRQVSIVSEALKQAIVI